MDVSGVRIRSMRRETEMARLHHGDERSPPRPEDESSAQRSRVDDQTPPDPGGVQSSPPPVAPPSTPFGTVAASRLVKAGESFIALEAQSCSRGFAYVVELGHESCDFDRGPNWMLERTVDDSVIVGPLATARLTARSNDRELAEQDKSTRGLHLRRDGRQHVQPLQGLWRTLAGWRVPPATREGWSNDASSGRLRTRWLRCLWRTRRFLGSARTPYTSL